MYRKYLGKYNTLHEENEASHGEKSSSNSSDSETGPRLENTHPEDLGVNNDCRLSPEHCNTDELTRSPSAIELAEQNGSNADSSSVFVPVISETEKFSLNDNQSMEPILISEKEIVSDFYPRSQIQGCVSITENEGTISANKVCRKRKSTEKDDHVVEENLIIRQEHVCESKKPKSDVININNNTDVTPQNSNEVSEKNAVTLCSSNVTKKRIDSQTFIVRGSINQSSEVFGSFSNSRQCTANAVSAIFFSKLLPPSVWVPQIIDKILFEGDKLYIESVTNRPAVASGERNVHFLNSSEIKDSIMMYGKLGRYKINNEVYGHIVHDLSENNVYLPNLKGLLSDLFQRKIGCGLFSCNFYTYCLMCSNSKLYLFDSHSRGPKRGNN